MTVSENGTGDLREDFFPAVGRCLHAWGFVELELANLYMILQSIERDAYGHPLRAAFEIVISLEIRVAMVNAYVSADPSLREYLPHCHALTAKIIRSYKKRHEIAHFLIGMEKTETGSVTALRPFMTMYGFSQKRVKALSLAQIKERTKTFNELAERARRHVQHIGALRGLPTTYYARAGEIAYPALGPEDLTQ